MNSYLFHLKPLPKNHEEAMEWLMQLVTAVDANHLAQIDSQTFKKGWYAVGFLYPGLHPDSEHGSELSRTLLEPTEMVVPDERLLIPYDVESGWLEILKPILAQAWQRYTSGELQDDEFYCAEAVMAGMYFRDPEKLKKFKVCSPEQGQFKDSKAPPS